MKKRGLAPPARHDQPSDNSSPPPSYLVLAVGRSSGLPLTTPITSHQPCPAGPCGPSALRTGGATKNPGAETPGSRRQRSSSTLRGGALSAALDHEARSLEAVVAAERLARDPCLRRHAPHQASNPPLCAEEARTLHPVSRAVKEVSRTRTASQAPRPEHARKRGTTRARSRTSVRNLGHAADVARCDGRCLKT